MRKTIRILTELSEVRVTDVVTQSVAHLGLPWLLIAIIDDVLKILNVVYLDCISTKRSKFSLISI